VHVCTHRVRGDVVRVLVQGRPAKVAFEDPNGLQHKARTNLGEARLLFLANLAGWLPGDLLPRNPKRRERRPRLSKGNTGVFHRRWPRTW
jgi:hypothetical protein